MLTEEINYLYDNFGIAAKNLGNWSYIECMYILERKEN